MNMMANVRRETDHEAGGVVKGVAIAVVTQNQDPENLCRVKVSFPWHDKPSESYWARLATPMAGAERGLVAIPEVGDEVLVAFEREDLRFPCVLGGLWNGKEKPPRFNGDGRNDERIFQSRKKHYLLFKDGSQGAVEIAHEKGRKVLFDDNGIVVQDEKGNSVKIDSNANAIAIEAVGNLTIKAARISIEATGTIDVKASATLGLRGALVNIN
jgi:uncharacterized protein involved in type VI secretion and phage assembly